MYIKFHLSHSRYSFILLLIVLFSFIFSLSSCTTTDSYTIKEPQTIEQEGVIKINSVVMKDSTAYSFKENEAIYLKKYKDVRDVIIYNSGKSVKDSINQKISHKTNLLFLKDISIIKYSRTYVSTTDALLTGGGIVLGVMAFLYLMLGLAIASGGGINRVN